MAMMKDKELNGDDGSSSGYMSSLVNSMSLMLEEFYSQLDVLACSAYTGQGFDDFMDAVDRKIEEYHEFYEAERDRILKEKAEREEKRKTDSLSKLMKDMDLKKGDEKDSHVLSDYEDEDDNNGEVDRDSEEETERQYTFPEDRNAEVSEKTDADLQARYQAAFEDTAKDASSKTAESIANYIRQ